MKVGDKVKVDLRFDKKPNGGDEREHKTGRIYAITDKLIAIEYLKDGKPTYRNSFNIADVIEEKVIISAYINRGWTRVTEKDFKV